jgi:hypothetical protein
MADGIAFQDTFDAIDRLHHVWSGKTVSAEFSAPHMGLARAVDVLEARCIMIGATDPIARNVASRVWNVAYATTDDAHLLLCDLPSKEAAVRGGVDLLLIVATAPLTADQELPGGTVNIVAQDGPTLTGQLARALADHASEDGDAPCCVRVELAHLNRYDGSVTNRVVQTTAIALLDALCTAFSA